MQKKGRSQSDETQQVSKDREEHTRKQCKNTSSSQVNNITDGKLEQQQDDLPIVTEKVRSRATIIEASGVSDSQAISQHYLIML